MGDLRFDGDRNLILSNGDQTFFSNALNFGENPPNMCSFADPKDPESGGVMQSVSPQNTVGKISYIALRDLEAWSPGSGRPLPLKNLALGFRNPCTFT
jgi:hypothetical protein